MTPSQRKFLYECEMNTLNVENKDVNGIGTFSEVVSFNSYPVGEQHRPKCLSYYFQTNVDKINYVNNGGEIIRGYRKRI